MYPIKLFYFLSTYRPMHTAGSLFYKDFSNMYCLRDRKGDLVFAIPGIRITCLEINNKRIYFCNGRPRPHEFTKVRPV